MKKIKTLENLIFGIELIIGISLITTGCLLKNDSSRDVLIAIGAGITTNGLTAGLVDIIKKILKQKNNERMFFENSKILSFNLSSILKIASAVNDPIPKEHEIIDEVKNISFKNYINFYIIKYGYRFGYNESLIESYFDIEKSLINQLDIILVSNKENCDNVLYHKLFELRHILSINQDNIFVINFVNFVGSTYYDAFSQFIKNENKLPGGVFEPAKRFFQNVNDIIALVNDIKETAPFIFLDINNISNQ